MTTSDFAARVLALVRVAGGVAPTASQLDQLRRYCGLLERWNTKINLTALPLAGFPDTSLNRLLIEPLIAAGMIQDSARRWLDLGSGGGSPAIPIKIVRPQLHLVMVESRTRKAAFLEAAVREAELAGVEVLNQRFDEPLSSQLPAADLLTVRGVRVDRALQERIKGVLGAGGRMLFFGAPADVPGFRLLTERPLPGSNSYLREFIPDAPSSDLDVPRGTIVG